MASFLCNQGGQYMLQCSFDGAQSPPACLFVGLCHDTPVKGDTLATLANELSGNGYERVAVSTNTTYISTSLDSGDYQARLSTVTHTAAGGAWSSANHAFVCTVNSGTTGKLIAVYSLSAVRILQNTDSLNTTLRIKVAPSS